MDEGSDEFRIVSRHKLTARRSGAKSTLHGGEMSKTAEDTEDRAPLLNDAADMGLFEEASINSIHSRSDSENTDLKQVEPEPLRPDMYVSIFDPINEPAFRPSKTKPLPKWMNLLPNNVHREREQRQRADEASQPEFHELKKMLKNTRFASGNMANTPTTHVHQNGEAQRSRSGTFSNQTTPESSPPLEIPRVARRRRTTISFDAKVTKEHTTGEPGDRNYRKSQTIDSIYGTPPEYPTTAPPARERTPFPRMSRATVIQEKPSSYFNRSIRTTQAPEPANEWCCGPNEDLQATGFQAPSPKMKTARRPKSMASFLFASKTPESLNDCKSEILVAEAEEPVVTPTSEVSPRKVQIVRPSPLQESSPFTANSSEYLDRYKPETAVAKVERYVAKAPEPIFDKIRRQKVGKVNGGAVIEDKRGERDTGGYGGYGDGNGNGNGKVGNGELRNHDRRGDLHKELTNLFRR
ncbi:hypothetical protein G7Y89_g10302 [Cudoniella acicularis]|uniref:Uncharacterized protein n=1 Tax=Cudoniella acicularis TaxID=354080 RepID=A0A8H4RD18_9HELO|nr:hypothetical protein G7Y89_g10302 [Cudoniella acicularis]